LEVLKSAMVVSPLIGRGLKGRAGGENPIRS